MNQARCARGFCVVTVASVSALLACSNERPNFTPSDRPRTVSASSEQADHRNVSDEQQGAETAEQQGPETAASSGQSRPQPPPGCGDGVHTPSTEQCDNGPQNSDVLPGACRTNCTTWGCGDAVIDNGEGCDDGVANSELSGAACRTTCQAAGCGDGILDTSIGETCDDGATNSDELANACRTDCKRATCGDGVRDTGEACDEGPANSDADGNRCNTKCLTANCGNGLQDAQEECDEGPANNDTAPDVCRTSCQKARCGDGTKDSEEECDNGPENSDTKADACRTDCAQHTCGDGIKDSDEECDSTANCTPECGRAECGNHITEVGEQCDGQDDCRKDCVLADCGNGTIEGTEECDSTDDCTNECMKVVCGDGKKEGNEACDEGAENSVEGTCTPECKSTFCGDNVKQRNEQCDDGTNTASYRGCAAGCKWAPDCGDGKVESGTEECDGGNECSPDCKRLPTKLGLGEKLSVGQALAKDSLRLEMRDSGELELLSNGSRVWSAGTSGSSGYVTVQDDGDVVIHTGGSPKWSSGTRNANGLVLSGDKLTVQKDSFVLKQLWPAAQDPDQLAAGVRMYAGNRLSSGSATFAVEVDGNWVMRRNGNIVWSTNMSGNPGAYASLQGDGNVVHRAKDSATLWSSDTRNGTTLKLTDNSLQLLDGDIMVEQFYPTTPRTTLLRRHRIYRGGSGLGAGELRLYIQNDGNVLLKDAANTTLWKTATQSNSGAVAEMLDSGDFAVVLDGNVVWSSQTVGSNNKLELEPTQLTIKDASNKVLKTLWSKE
jgi:hypothetical protein